MRLLLLAVAAPSLALITVPAGAQTSNAGDDKIVCKKEPREGSRVLTRVCKTQRDWNVIAEEAKRSLAETRDQPQINPTNCGGTRAC